MRTAGAHSHSSLIIQAANPFWERDVAFAPMRLLRNIFLTYETDWEIMISLRCSAKYKLDSLDIIRTSQLKLLIDIWQMLSKLAKYFFYKFPRIEYGRIEFSPDLSASSRAFCDQLTTIESDCDYHSCSASFRLFHFPFIPTGKPIPLLSVYIAHLITLSMRTCIASCCVAALRTHCAWRWIAWSCRLRVVSSLWSTRYEFV